MWNGPLDPDVLLKQLRDMNAHGARSVCALPMPRQFRPESTNNQMDLDYLSPEFFERVRIVAEEANHLGMNYWLYDEGGWPSGEACGQVLQNRPDLASRVARIDEDGSWHITESPGLADLLNPEATRTFINLTHEGYLKTVGKYFGRTIRFAFTDEPAVRFVIPGRQTPWTKGLEEDFANRFGYRIEEHLDAFRNPPGNGLAKERMQIRIDFFDWWSDRFRKAYFKPLRQWSRRYGLLSGGHLGGEDETLGAAKYGFGHVLRILREMDLPGVDAIWRQLFPGQANHHFPKFAATAAHQNGTPLVFTESFAVYGNGLTIDQMKWIVDYQYVRGINLLVGGCYPLSTREHLMPGERPHFGPVNPLWDHMPVFHRYVARLGYALSCGQPIAETALYYPVRDIWAHGLCTDAVIGYERLAQALLDRQCEYDLVDDDVLSAKATRIEHGALCVGPMRYRRIIIGPCEWLEGETVDRLSKFVLSGGKLLCLDRLPGTQMDGGVRLRTVLGDGIDKVKVGTIEDLAPEVPPLAELKPPSALVRMTARRLDDGVLYLLVNEGKDRFEGWARFRERVPPKELAPTEGQIWSVREASQAGGTTVVPLSLQPGQSLLLLFDGSKGKVRPLWEATEGAELILEEGWQACVIRRFDVGPHDYEIRRSTTGSPRPVRLGGWKEYFGEDFSGDVSYRIPVDLPKEWAGLPLRLDLGRVEYAARVRINDKDYGSLVWPPWKIELPDLHGRSRLDVEVIVTNTLANILTSERVRNDWGNRKGAGWPGPYHVRALDFEMGSRGGGLFGPVRLECGRYL